MFLRDSPIVVLAELLQTNHAGGGHGRAGPSAAFVVRELARLTLLIGFIRLRAATRAIVLAHVANRHLDHLGRNFQAAIDGAAQRLGLHHGETQVVPMILSAAR